MKETGISCCDPTWAFISSDETRWRNRIIRLADEHPDECIIIKYPEDNDGFIYAKFPPRWLRIAPPQVREMTDEQRAAAAERLRKAREGKAVNSDG